MSWLQLANKVAIVTGGGSGIGRITALSLASQGCSVVCSDFNLNSARDTVEQISKMNLGKSVAVRTDVRRIEDTLALIARADEMAHELYKAKASILVNSAGITKDGFLGTMTEADFDDVIDVNLKGTFLTCKAFAAPERLVVGDGFEGGSIINISSVIGRYGNIGQANYAASKAGVIGLTNSLAKELARSNIRVNAVLPGFIKTPMTDLVPAKVVDKMKVMIALKRLGEPEDIANLVLFLASDRSGYMTGCEIQVDGKIAM